MLSRQIKLLTIPTIVAEEGEQKIRNLNVS